MNNDSQALAQHFDTLKSKYKATNYKSSSPSSLLYFILRKADIQIELNKFDWSWLLEQNLLETIEIIKQQEQYKSKEINQLETEFFQLKSKYQVPPEPKIDTSSLVYQKLISKYRINPTQQLEILNPLYFILKRLESENQLTKLEFEWLKQNTFTKIVELAQKINHFATLKAKYKATQHQDLFPDSDLYQILKDLEVEARLSETSINWLQKQQLLYPLEVFQQHEQIREARFAKLKDKYQASKHPESSVSCFLYSILQKLDANTLLSSSEIDWLKKYELTETISIAEELEQKKHFDQLKIKYKATQLEDSSPSSHLYKVLKKLELNICITESDINFLRKRKLTDTLRFALNKYAVSLQSKISSGEQLNEDELKWLKQNDREDIIIFGQEKHFAILKSKYDVSNYKDKSPESNLYAILKKLEKLERLEPTDIAWLEENKTEGYHSYGWGENQSYRANKLFSGKIFTTYHKIEATFYEQEYKSTGNKWNIPNASSHWRNAEQPSQALKVTENIDLDKIKENKLKSALLTTRGGAFRDINKLHEAEACAKKAIEYQPNSHHPYTLMGAICLERHQYLEGERWFEEAIKRGASPQAQDAEIRRVVKNTKDKNKQKEVVEYLLKKDSRRYAWAKSYLKTNQKK